MQKPTEYHGRRAVSIENAQLRLTVLVEGGHVAEILHKASGVNPLWTPPWTSMEPSRFDAAAHAERYGAGADARLLAGIMGHNLCADIFGPPSEEEAAAGLTVHGEASVVPYDVQADGQAIVMHAHLQLAELQIERRIDLHDDTVRFTESIENLGGTDRPIGWTQHVTLGPPFLHRRTEFDVSATRSRSHESTFGTSDYIAAAADFDWPEAPGVTGGVRDLRRFPGGDVSSAYTAHLMDPSRQDAFFTAFSPDHRLALSYLWDREDFPWLGIWEEHLSRTQPPWSGKTVARGMEFGVSPFPETRRRMIERRRLFDTPTFRWIPASGRVSVQYRCHLRAADRLPDMRATPIVS